jgi:MbtH protein
MSWDSEDTMFRVVVNHEEQYSIWPDYLEMPAGWREVGVSGPKQTCLDHIKEVWTDMRPLSLRKHMESLAGQSVATAATAATAASAERPKDPA